MRIHEFRKSLKVGDKAAQLAKEWLRSLPQTKGLVSVEADKAYQKRDIDFLWETDKGFYRVEVKGDTWGHKTGNLFFETTSNVEQDNDGCFMYTEADLLLYLMLKSRELYILPVEDVRAWFIREIERFRKQRVKNKDYTTTGRLVPGSILKREVSEVIKVKL